MEISVKYARQAGRFQVLIEIAIDSLAQIEQETNADSPSLPCIRDLAELHKRLAVRMKEILEEDA